MTDSRIDLKSLTQAELSELLTDRGFPKYRAKQVMDWLQKGAVSADEMTNLPADLKNFIQNYCYISVSIIEKKLISRYDKTVKYLGQKRLFALPDRLRNDRADRGGAA